MTTPTSTSSKLEKALESDLLPPVDLRSVYSLYYRHGSNTSCFKLFEHKGDLASAAQRGRTHCELMGYVFIYVKPFLSDLEWEEKRKLRNFGDQLDR